MYTIIKDHNEELISKELDIKYGNIDAEVGNLFEFSRNCMRILNPLIIHVAYNGKYALSLLIRPEEKNTFVLGYYPDKNFNRKLYSRDLLVNMMLRANILLDSDIHNYEVTFSPEIYKLI